MEAVNAQYHGKETFFYLLSKALERAAYYGIRVLIVVYMISETMDMDRTDALSIYGWFTVLIIMSQIAGAVLGDLAIGNRKSIILGGVIQAIGAFCLCISTIEGLYLGLILVVIGGGLYTPNITSCFGKLYFNRTKLLDSAFGMYYLAMNLGAFLGILLISYYGEEYGFNVGFMIAGTLMLLSIIPILGSGKRIINYPSEVNFLEGNRVGDIIVSILLVATFWAIYEMSAGHFVALQLNLGEISMSGMSESMWKSFQAIILFPILVVLVSLWTYFYSSYQFKLMLGFVFGAISYATLLFIPEIPGEQHVFLYLFSLVLLGLSEAHIAPIVNSVVVKYANPKYMAIIFSLVFIPSRMFAVILGVFSEDIYDKPIQSLKMGMVAMLLIAAGLVAFLLTKKKKTPITT